MKTGRVALAIIQEILLRFPGEYELAKCFSDNPKLQDMLGSEDVALVRAYMKVFFTPTWCITLFPVLYCLFH